MPILKPTSPAARNAVVLDLGDLAAQAERLLDQARAEAEAIARAAVESSQAAVDAARKRAEEDGYKAGLARGLEEGRAEARAEVLAKLAPRIERIVEGWTGALQDIEARRERILREATDDVALLAIALGRKVAHRHVATDPRVVVDQVEAALEMLRRPGDVQVQVHPKDRPLVEDVLPELVARFANCRHLHLRDDESVGLGGCVVVTEAGRIDAALDTQLERIAEALVPGRRGGGAAP